MYNFASSDKELFFEMLNASGITYIPESTYLTSLDELDVNGLEELDACFDAILDLFSWLEVVDSYGEKSAKQQQNTIRNCIGTGSRSDTWSMYMTDNSYHQICFTPSLCMAAVEFHVSYKDDKKDLGGGLYELPPTINGLIASESLTASLVDFISDFNSMTKTYRK